jgi:CubicO group peptidase (beta-lactamase class C family)
LYLPGRGVLRDDLRRESVSTQAESAHEARGLGWQLRTESNQAAALSAAAFGHTGFTGTSVWVDPEVDLVTVLLTNRIHPEARPSGIQEIRRRMNELVASAYL